MTHRPGDRVFAKIKGFSNWPARVSFLGGADSSLDQSFTSGRGDSQRETPRFLLRNLPSVRWNLIHYVLVHLYLPRT